MPKCDNIENSENADFYLSTDRIKDSPKITVSMDYDIETKTVQLGGMTVSYNPISIDVTLADMAEDMCAECDWNGSYLYFRMKDGEIKTLNRLYKYSGKDSTSISAWARGIIEHDEIQSIIANGAEYLVSDSSAVKAVKIDKTLKPFVMKLYIKDHLWLPLREFCENIGAEITRNEKTSSAEVKYRGSVYVFTLGSSKVVIDVKTVDFYDGLNDSTTFADENGRMIVTPLVADYMGIDLHGFNMSGENGSINPDAQWHIIP